MKSRIAHRTGLRRTEVLRLPTVSVTEEVLQEHTHSRRFRSVRIAPTTPEHLARCIVYQTDTGMAGTRLRTNRRTPHRCTPVSVSLRASAVRIRTRPWHSIRTARA